MLNPRLSRGALARLGLVGALMAALFASRFARADEAARWPCAAPAKAREVMMRDGGAEPARMTGAQWRFLQSVSFVAPDTPASRPPGDHALIAMRADGSAGALFMAHAGLWL